MRADTRLEMAVEKASGVQSPESPRPRAVRAKFPIAKIHSFVFDPSSFKNKSREVKRFYPHRPSVSADSSSFDEFIRCSRERDRDPS